MNPPRRAKRLGSKQICQRTGGDCVSFTLAVPGVNAFVGTFSGASTQYIQGAGAASYNVDGQPVPHADGTPVCGQTDVKSGIERALIYFRG